ncbi:enoyl-CoA hydratase/isomerase family protein [Halocynthiibacter styelae]|uniref:3-hydroxyisobutyryl-CoA hydrolase n=1 Tax=Halocynthiibacter styelae TaxID=2761955 RepID=A0A8J7LKD9_9RHOB|nr:enoyl-CoA hydratase/isomerase family protein [Paenihalocynthiibacter styelae]MBI1492414.1 enoyl-CoA hydratase/isomerase family protein [Paenihalocynthiibacter styelae]
MDLVKSDDIHIRREGHVGRITLTRPKAFNALGYQMALEVEKALDAWRDDDAVKLILLDADGDRAFCAGGDIQEMYDTAKAGDFEYGRTFWRDEYRMNAKMFEFPKPVVSLMQGFTMGGGVGIGCHGSHRVVCDSSRIAMPECGIGLIPDVGGTLILARAPGRLGEYIGMSGVQLGAADAIYAGFADYYIPEEAWPDLIKALCETGDVSAVDAAARTAQDGALAANEEAINRHFTGETALDILRNLDGDDSEFAQKALKTLRRNSPLAVAATVELVHRARGAKGIRAALGQEYRFTHRAASEGDFIEGIRAQIIDKDRNPTWKHASVEDLSPVDVTKMLMPVPGIKVEFEGEEP